ncbi:unnamed protein product [Lupinus luteus]|uniref:Uncharacterized protein n=1 Tax=Lupinus luteus TaxID=3873 RepID=A0AAV1WW90_LUPLU
MPTNEITKLEEGGAKDSGFCGSPGVVQSYKRPVSGASMNPARSLGPAVAMHIFYGFWLYIVGPFLGAILGASAYNLIRFTEKPLREIGASLTFLKTMSRANTFR